MADAEGSTTSFAAITSGVLSFLGAPHVRVEEIADRGARAAFLGFDGANAAIERPGSANGPRGLRIASLGRSSGTSTCSRRTGWSTAATRRWRSAT